MGGISFYAYIRLLPRNMNPFCRLAAPYFETYTPYCSHTLELYANNSIMARLGVHFAT